MNEMQFEAYLALFPPEVDEYFIEGTRTILQSVDLTDVDRLEMLKEYFVVREEMLTGDESD